MKNKNKRVLRRWLSGALLAVGCQMLAPLAFAASDPQAAGAAATGQPVVLSDKVHSLTATLDDPSTVHEYRFQALRGQHVLIATPKPVDYGKLWQVQYQVDGGQWRTKLSWAESLNDLTPGAQVAVRVQAVAGARFDKLEYGLVFGSRPYMSYDLHHERGVVPIPYHMSEPPFMTTQALKESLLEVRVWDSTGNPLEGGVARISLSASVFHLQKDFVSDSSGRISELLVFDRCSTYSKMVRYRVDKKTTWRVEYDPGFYDLLNVLPEHLADKPHVFNFGHICKQFKVWTPKK